VACDHVLLKENEVTHILNVASFNTQFTIDRGPGDCAINKLFIYKHVSIMDLPDTDITSYFDECFAFIDSALDTGGRILVHCMAGVSRAASIVIGYLMKVNNMDFQTAFNHVKAKRPSIRPNDGFMHQLQNYEGQLKQQKYKWPFLFKTCFCGIAYNNWQTRQPVFSLRPQLRTGGLYWR